MAPLHFVMQFTFSQIAVLWQDTDVRQPSMCEDACKIWGNNSFFGI